MPRKSKSTKKVGRKIRGKGDYKVDKSSVNPLVNKIVRKIGSAIGGFGGSYLGSPAAGAYAGDYVANKAHKLFKRVTGFGDYKISENSLVLGDNVPEFANISNREVRIMHKEYIGDLYCAANGAFKIQNFKINPGSSIAFPWLSGMSQNYQQYRINGMIFYFKSTSANALNSTNTNLGQVLISTNYNVLSKSFENTSDMLNAEFSTSGKPSSDMVHMIECAPRETPIKELYIRNSSVPVNEISDDRLYDYCNIQVATVGMQSTSEIMVGQLWISYDITLMKNISSQNILLADQYVFAGAGRTPLNSSSVFCNSNVLDANLLRTNDSTFGTKIVRGAGGAWQKIVFPPTFKGSVRVDYNCVGMGIETFNSTPTVSLYGGVTHKLLYNGNTVSFATNMNGGGTPTVSMYSICLNIENKGVENAVEFSNWRNPDADASGFSNIIITTIPTIL